MIMTGLKLYLGYVIGSVLVSMVVLGILITVVVLAHVLSK